MEVYLTLWNTAFVAMGMIGIIATIGLCLLDYHTTNKLEAFAMRIISLAVVVILATILIALWWYGHTKILGF